MNTFKLKVPIETSVCKEAGIPGALYKKDPNPVMADNGEEQFRFVSEASYSVKIRLSPERISDYFEEVRVD